MTEVLKSMSNMVKNALKKEQLDKYLSEAVSDENWQASTTTLNAIADATYDHIQEEKIKDFIQTQLKKVKNWRRLLKSLILLEHIIKNGSQRIVRHFKEKVYDFRSFEDYTYTQDKQDKGLSIREKSKLIIRLLTNDEYLEDEKIKAKKIRNVMSSQIGNKSISGTTTTNISTTQFGGSEIARNSLSSYSYQNTTNPTAIYNFPSKTDIKPIDSQFNNAHNTSNKIPPPTTPKNSFEELAARLKNADHQILHQPKIQLKKPQPAKKIVQQEKKEINEKKQEKNIFDFDQINTNMTSKVQSNSLKQFPQSKKDNKKQSDSLLEFDLLDGGIKAEKQINLSDKPKQQPKRVQELNLQQFYHNQQVVQNKKKSNEITLATTINTASKQKEKEHLTPLNVDNDEIKAQWLTPKEKDLIDLTDFSMELKKPSDAPKQIGLIWDW